MTRVLQIPGAHPYVDQCVGGSSDVTVVSVNGIPSPAFDRPWLAAHRHEFAVVHLHFGFEHLSVHELAQWLGDLERYLLPLVYTVHDLRNPHQLTPEAHDRHLDLLIPAATSVFTLTTGAAAQILQRWGRQAEVVAHPYVIDPSDRPRRVDGTQERGRNGVGQGVVGLHLKDLRTNIVDPDRVIAAVAKGARDGEAELRVDLHPGVVSRPELAGTRALAAAGDLTLAVHPRFDDQELAEYLSSLDVFVLPYRFGTHSGWLEACRDVGTRVVVPSCGHYQDQWDETIVYQHDEIIGLDEGSLADAVRRALIRPPLPPAAASFRHEQRDTVRSVHAQVYADLAHRVGS